jgi:hypothetical protein
MTGNIDTKSNKKHLKVESQFLILL